MFVGRMNICVGPGPSGGSERMRRNRKSVFVAARSDMTGRSVGIRTFSLFRYFTGIGRGRSSVESVDSWLTLVILSTGSGIIPDGPSPADSPSLFTLIVN